MSKNFKKLNLALLLCLFLVISANAQRDFDIIQNKIDSLINKNKYRRTVGFYDSMDFKHFSKRTALERRNCKHFSLEEEEFIFKHLAQIIFTKDTFFNKRRIAYQLTFSLGQYSSNINIRKKVVETLLGAGRIPHSENNIMEVFTLFRRQDFSEKAKKQVFRIVFLGYNDLEKEYHRDYYIPKRIKPEYCNYRAQEILKKEKKWRARFYGKRLRFLKDSLYNNRIAEYESYLSRRRCPTPLLIKAVGYLNIKVDRALIDSFKDLNCHSYGRMKKHIEYLLAKQGDKEKKDSIFRIKNFNYRYFETEEALFAYLSHFDMDKPMGKYVNFKMKNNNIYMESTRYYCMMNIQNYVKNLPDNLRLPTLISPYELEEHKAKQAYDWLQLNKGNLILNNDRWPVSGMAYTLLDWY